jgi:hypothetical protein
MTELILLSLKIRSRGLALVWCSVRRNIATGNNIFWPYHARLHCVQLAFVLYILSDGEDCWLTYLPRQKVVNPPHPKRVGTSVFAAEQLVVLCYWLVGYAFSFLIGCRLWVCFFTRVDAGMAFWRLAVSSWRSVRRCVVVSGGMLWDAVAAECCDICRGCSR